MLIQVYDLLKTLPTLDDITIPADGKVTVCGDVHGQFYDLANIFALNGVPSVILNTQHACPSHHSI